MSTSRRHLQATFKRAPAPNWRGGMKAALAAIRGETGPVAADEAAHFEREAAAVPYRGRRQRDLPLGSPEGGGA